MGCLLMYSTAYMYIHVRTLLRSNTEYLKMLLMLNVDVWDCTARRNILLCFLLLLARATKYLGTKMYP